MDLAITRFPGAPCSPPSGASALLRGAHDAEQAAAGFWAGGPTFPRPAFYAYAYPRPDRIEAQPVRPEPAVWNDDLGEFVLPYDAVRTATSPAALVREFLDDTYEAAARLRGWDPGLVSRRS
jgi:hypothetical protein